MPASPSLPSGTRGNKWKRRKREPQNQSANRRLKDDEDEEDEDEDDLNDRDDDAAAEDANPNAPDPNPRETEVLAAGGVRISEFPLVVKRMVNRPHSSVLSIVAAERACSTGDSSSVSGIVLENVSYGQLQALSAVPADSSSLTDGEGPSSFVATPPKLMEGKGVVHRYGDGVLVVPMHSDWFSPYTVHRLERQVVPHFFSGKSPDHTPEKYRECRNHIVAKYMENPDKRLTVSDFPGSVVGVNEDDLARIVRFLDHWGIINYCATSSPTRDPYHDGSYLKEDQNGEVHVPSAALKSIDSLIKFDKPKCILKDGGVCSSSSIKDNGVSDLDNQIRECLSENCCNHCSRPLLAIYYQSQKEVDVFLCVDCFHEGRFVVGHSSIDFFRVDSTKAHDYLDGESWTDQETLLLLEAMELYGDNWNGIAEHVGTKSKAQCILHFVRLPMEDGLLENIEVPGAPNLSSGDDPRNSHSHTNGNLEESGHQGGDTEDRIPFANSSNPVMALVAFLASAVAPRVAAECAHAALAALSGEAESGNDIQAEGAVEGQSMNVEAQAGDPAHQKGGQTEADSAAAVSPEKVKVAARIGLAAAATKAKLFADHEEREIQRLYATIINQQLKRLELKLKQFAEVETLLMRECDQMEKGRQRLAGERARIMSSRLVPTPTVGPPHSNLGPTHPSMVNPGGTNPRPPVMSGPTTPLQPSMSGFGGTQIPSQMPFMPPRQQQQQQQQQMFPLGPRLPLSAINSSPAMSSPSASVGFNPQGSSQNAPLNHPMMRSLSGTSSNLG